ncbi:MAG: thioredoxin domain-containing protein [Candidatus Hydrogenedentes bacterium]|nr:thioredoxin domain-containing protein [Candidatus Hydrogenedentota bacterium]
MPENIEHRYTNHLARETSPYLLQHAHNPVDWFPWTQEAIDKARAEDKPIFLSIGYAACHWCHVMERESFENEDIAQILNEHYVSVKVDRDERPDLDEIYMTATVAMTGAGGWPMSVFLTPDLKPFYCGTYFPPLDMYGRPGFSTVLLHIARAWQQERDQLLKGAEGLTKHIEQQLSATAPQGALTPDLLRNAAAYIKRSYDPQDGGWGGAPKFPSSGSIMLLLREYRHTGDRHLLEMATNTLDHMARGGIYDHLGGGFARYSVDAQWLVPHFEKMLYDNAQLSLAYLEAFQLTGNGFYRQVAQEIFEYELRDMRDERGAFHSTEDADSEGEEGKFYLWTQDEIYGTLGQQDGYVFCQYFGVRENGNFSSHETYHEGQNILHLSRPADTLAKDLQMPVAGLMAVIERSCEKLFARRAQRVRPGLDDKVLTAWNALLISSLSQGAQILGETRYLDAAVAAGEFIKQHMMRDGQLLRTHRHGESRLPAYLDDYAFTVNAFVDLYECTFDLRWLRDAEALADSMITQFWDDAAGNFFYTSGAHPNLIVRTKPAYDGAEPSGNSIAALALQRLAVLRDRAEYREKARRILEAASAHMKQAPQGFLRMLCALDFYLHPPQEIAIIGGKEAEDTRQLVHAIFAHFVPNKVVAAAVPGKVEETAKDVPLLAGKVAVDGKATAYVCKNFTCDAPVTNPEALVEKLGNTVTAA